MPDKRDDRETMTSVLDVMPAVGDAGMVSVPAKPSTAMLAAGAEAGRISVESAWRIYLAMVRAAE